MKDLVNEVFLPEFRRVLLSVIGDEGCDLVDYAVIPVMLPVQGEAVVGISYFLLRPAIALGDYIAKPGVIPNPYAGEEEIRRSIQQTYQSLNEEYRKEQAAGLQGKV